MFIRAEGANGMLPTPESYVFIGTCHVQWILKCTLSVELCSLIFALVHSSNTRVLSKYGLSLLGDKHIKQWYCKLPGEWRHWWSI